MDDKNQNWIPNVLILGPGSVRGFIHLGVLHHLREQKVVENVDTIVGEAFVFDNIEGNSSAEVLSVTPRDEWADFF